MLEQEREQQLEAEQVAPAASAEAAAEAAEEAARKEAQPQPSAEAVSEAAGEAARVEAVSEAAEEAARAEAVRADTTREAETAEAAPAAEAPGEGPRRKRVWYVLHTYSGYENKVKKALEKSARDAGMEKEIFQVIVPTEEEVEIKDGHKRTVERRVFPGYVLVEMLEFIENDPQSDEAWYLIRHTNGVTGFVGEGTRPTPLPPSDVDKIMGRMQQAQPKVKISFKVGNSVRITDGPFADFIGTVDELMVDKGKVRVLVNFFGRETPVELDFIQVEKQ